ncbi:MBL fold metallo-hydrolase [Paenibacillus glycinis]|uniref:MBL fold metallo-hydrolase n=1 Tax=Paenibacillus glycinis TaxID=2697035 RepID=A0ABW9XWC7_9BACL|nr:MBL fold metallo-hydrolase [Paenibacillus glycinis]NBD27024.1 MBL fold metallo-hydrolase [Paenibacillus glycinis]
MSLSYEVHTLKVASGDYINYCYVIIDKATRYAAIVDPAWELDKILDLLNELQVELKMILLTHSHDDHMNLALALVEQFIAQPYMSELEIDFYQFELPSLISFKDSERIQLGSTMIQCLITPGHTFGSACFLLSQDIFTGDTIFFEGCGGCSYKGGNPESMFDSIQRLKKLLSPNIRVYPGHSFGESPGRPMSLLLTHNIYFHLDRLDFVEFRMRKNQTNLYSFK